LKSSTPLYGSGFLTEGVLHAQGEAAEGIKTTLHYSDGLVNSKNQEFRMAYSNAFGEEADVYAVQGYDAGLLLRKALEATNGDLTQRSVAIAAMEGAEIDSPRGSWRMSRAHNPIQNFYTLKVEGGENKVVGTAWEGLEDPASGCSL
jgi:branched-chain amino acid transport system substrate-binding protein